MDVMAILALIAKGVSVAELLIDAGKSAVPAIEVIKKLVTGAQSGTITDAELLALEDSLDAQIDDFNTPIG